MKKIIFIIFLFSTIPIFGQDSLWNRRFLTLGEDLTINGLVYSYDRFIGHSAQDYPFKRGLDQKWTIDNSLSATNFFMHPLHGSLYHITGRLNKLSFLETVLFNAIGSATWELGAENENPSINDIIVTPLAGSLFGESIYKLITKPKNVSEYNIHLGNNYIGLGWQYGKYIESLNWFLVNFDASYDKRVFVRDFSIIGNLYSENISDNLDIGFFQHLQYKSDKPDRNSNPNYMFAEGVSYGLGLIYDNDVVNVSYYVNGIVLGAYQLEGNKYKMAPGSSVKSHFLYRGKRFSLGNKFEIYQFPHKRIIVIAPHVQINLFKNFYIKTKYELDQINLEIGFNKKISRRF